MNNKMSLHLRGYNKVGNFRDLCESMGNLMELTLFFGNKGNLGTLKIAFVTQIFDCNKENHRSWR